MAAINNFNADSLVAGSAGNDIINNLGVNSTVKGGAGADDIYNAADNSFIYAEGGNDTLQNFRAHVFMSGGADNDSICNYGEYSTVNGDAGNDLIINNFGTIGNDHETVRAEHSYVNGGAGNDSIKNGVTDVTIEGGAGTDSIINQGSNSFIDGGDDNDFIQNSGASVKVEGGNGDDIIDNYIANVTINGGDGNDNIYNTGANVSINAGESHGFTKTIVTNTIKGSEDEPDSIQTDTIYSGEQIDNYGSNATLKSGKGGALLINSGANSYIEGGDDDDEIHNWNVKSLVRTGNGNNFVFNGVTTNTGGLSLIVYGSQSTIEGGDGNDTIYNDVDRVKIRAGGGNDIIGVLQSAISTVKYNYNDIDAGDGDDQILLAAGADYSTVDGGAGDDDIQNESSNSLLNGGAGNDHFYVGGSHNTIDGGDGNDNIESYAEYSSVDGGAGNDEIIAYSYSTVFGGDDHDTIYVNSYSSINGGTGNDNLSAYRGSNNTLVGGNGNDTIDIRESSKTLIQYRAGDGDDLILGLKEDDTLEITGGSYDGYTLGTDINSENVILKIGSGSITLYKYSGQKLRLKLADGSDTQFYVGPVQIENKTKDTTVDTTDYNDTIRNHAENATIYAGGGDDDVKLDDSNNVKLDLGSGDDTVAVYTGSANVSINAGAGSDVITNERNENVTILAGEGQDKITSRGDKNYIDGGAHNDSIVNYGADTTIKTGAGDDSVYNKWEEVWLDDGSSIIAGGSRVVIDATGGGNNYIFNGKYNSNVSITGSNTGADIVENEGEKATINTGAAHDKITNSGANSYIEGGAGNDSVYNSGEKSTVVGGAGNDYVSLGGSANVIKYSVGDGNDTVYGFDENDTLDISDSSVTAYTIDGNNVILKIGNGNDDSINLIGAKSKKLWIREIDSITQKIFGPDNIYNAASNTLISAEPYDDSIKSSGQNVTIKGNGGNDIIELTTNATAVIQYAAGDGADTIKGLSADDTLNIVNGTLDSYTVNGNNDLLLSIDGTQVVIEKGNGMRLNVLDSNNKLTSKYYGAFTLGSSASSTVIATDSNAYDDYISVTGDNVTVNTFDGNDTVLTHGDNVSINGGAGNDSIISTGKSSDIGNKNVTILGGAGNDTVRIDPNSAGNVIQYAAGDGNDVIIGFNEKYSLQIPEGSYKGYSLGNGADSVDVIVTVGNGTLTLKEAAGQYLHINDSLLPFGPMVINNATDNRTVSTGIYNDSITNHGAGATINPGAGNDTVDNQASLAVINGGDGDDTIKNVSQSVTLRGGAGNDVVDNSGSNVSIDGGDGNDSIVNNGQNVTVNGGDGDDTIKNVSQSVTLRGGAGNDVVYNSGSNVSIDGGDGNDSIVNNGQNVTVNAGSGDDTINRADVYRYSNGHDMITDYATDDNLVFDAAVNHSVDNKDIVFNNNAGTLRIVGGNGKMLKVNGVSQYYGYATINNTTSNIEFTTDDYADSITNAASNVTINAAVGNDTVQNSGANVSINGDAGDDLINNEGSNVSINAGAGNDTVDLANGSAIYQYDSGNDVIVNYSTSDTIRLNSSTNDYYTVDGADLIFKLGNDSLRVKNGNGAWINVVDASNKFTSKYYGSATINNTIDNIPIATDDYADSITNSARNVTINAGAGIDTITNHGAGASLNGGIGNDVIYNRNNSSLTAIDGGAGDDHIENDAAQVTMQGSGGADIIVNRGDNVSVDGGNDNDSISNAGTNVTLRGGAGNDTVDLANGSAIYQYTSGNDVIVNYSTSDTIRLNSSTNDYYTVDGADLIFKLGNDSLRVKNGNGAWINVVDSSNKFTSKYYGSATINNTIDNIPIATDDYADSITNSARNVTINAGAGIDTITNHGAGASLNGGIGNDAIYNRNNSSLTAIDGGAGDDHIENDAAQVTMQGSGGADIIVNRGDNVSVDGGNDNDSINNAGTNVTLSGGAGNDTVDLGTVGGALVRYIEGYDVLQNVGANDTIQLATGTVDSLTLGTGSNANDVIINGSITVKNGKGQLLNLIDGNGNEIHRTFGGANIEINAQNLLLENSAHNDNVTNYASGATINAGAGNDTIINDADQDHNAVNISTAHYSITGLNDRVLLNGGDGNDYIENKGEAATVEGGSGNDTIRNAHTTIWLNNNQTETITGSRSLLNGGAGDDSIVNDALNENVTINGGTGADYIVNNALNVIINAGKDNDTVDAGTGGALIQYAADDGNDVIINFDANDTLNITYGAIDEDAVSVGGVNQTDLIFKVGDGTITLKDARNRKIKVLNAENILTEKVYGPVSIDNSNGNSTIGAGKYDDYIRNVAERVTIQSDGGNDTVDNAYELTALKGGGESLKSSGAYAVIQTDVGNDVINNYGAHSTVNAGAGNDTITNRAETYWLDTANANSETVGGSNALLNGDAGNDHIVNEGGAINVTLDAGAGNDFITNAGDSALLDGGAGADSISNSARSVSIFGGADNDSIVDSGKQTTIKAGTGNDTITLTDNSNALIQYANGDGNDVIRKFSELDTIAVSNATITDSYADGDNYVVEITGKTVGKITLEGVGSSQFALSNDKKSLTFDTAPINIINNKSAGVLTAGSSDADSIVNSAKGVTIRGNGGNDTITGSGNAEMILYSEGDGNDLITNFGDNDTLKILSGRVTSHYAKGQNYLINVGSGMITLGGMGSKRFTQTNGAFTVDTTPADYNYIFNGTDNTIVTGNASAEGADYIVNTGDRVTIDALGGNDTITGSDLFGEVYRFSAFDGANVITNFGLNDTLHCTGGTITSYAADGNDLLVTLKRGDNQTSTVRLQDMASYVDMIKKTDSNLIIDGITQIVNQQPKQKVVGSDGRDYIINTGDRVTIQAGASNDTIEGSDEYGELFLFGAADGENVIKNFGKNDTVRVSSGSIQSGAAVGKDYVLTLKNGKTIGTVTLLNASGFEPIQTKNSFAIKDNPYIINRADSIKVAGTGSDDYIANSGEHVTIQAGGGNDTISGSNFGEQFWFSYASGDDVILNFDENDTLKVTSGTISAVETVDNDVVVSIKKKGQSEVGTVTLKNAANLSDGNLEKADSTTFIFNKINRITVEKDDAKTSGTGARDYISNPHGYTGVSIQAGGDDDTIEGSTAGEVFMMSYASGDDVVTNFGKNDTLACTSGTITAVDIVGNDAVVTLKKKNQTAVGKITLQGAGDYNFINSGSKLTVDQINRITVEKDDAKTSGTGARDYISNPHGYTGVSIQAGGDDDTIEGSDAGEVFMMSYASGDDVITNFGKNDTLACTSGTITAVDIVGNDAVVTLTKKNQTAVGMITLQGAGDYNFINSGSKLTVDQINRITVEKDNEKTSGTGAKDYISNPHGYTGVSIQAGGDDDTIEGSDAGEVFMMSYASGDDVITNFGKNDTLACTSGTITAVDIVGNDAVVTLQKKNQTAVGKITLQGAGDYNFINSGSKLTVDYVTTITGTKDGETLHGTDGRDLISNTYENVVIVGSAGNDTITGSDTFGELYQLSSLDGDDVITNFGKNDTLHVTNGSIYSTVLSSDGNDLIVKLGKASTAGKVTLQGAGAYRHLIKKSGKYLLFDDVTTIINRKDKMKVNGTGGRDYIVNSGDNVTINSGGGDDTVIASDSAEVISFAAGGGEDLIRGFGTTDTLYISSGSISSRTKFGDNYIVNVKSGKTIGTITLEGAGHYVFDQNGNNNELLTVRHVNYTVNNKDDIKVSGTSNVDYIYNSGSNVTIQAGGADDTIEGSNYGEMMLFSYASGDDVVLNFGKNDSLMCTSGTINKVEKIGSDTVITFKKSKKTSTVTLNNTANYRFNYDSTLLTVDDINVIDNDRDTIKVSGTNGRDYITNTAENVTIQAGGKNDTIDGSDLYGEIFQFSYASGDDLIRSFGENDTLQCTSGTFTYKKSGDDVIVTITKSKKTEVGTVTLGGAGNYDLIKKGDFLFADPVHTIKASKDGQKVSGTTGKDLIINNGYEKVSIQAGGGNDTIEGSNFGEVFMMSYASGDDVVTNFGANDTLKSTSGTLSYKINGDDVVVSIAKKGKSTVGNITLEGAAIYKDFLTVKSSSALYVKGINIITNTKNKVKVTGQTTNDGIDYITNTGQKVTIQAGGGNDIITGSDSFGERFQFSYASGDDTITNFSLGDTLQSTSGTLSYKKVGNDYVVTIKKSGKSTVGTITLQDAAENYTLTKSGSNYIATPKSTNAQLPSEDDYWFLDSQSTKDDPLSEIVSTESAVDLPTDFNDAFEQSAVELAANARHRQNKIRRLKLN